MARPELAARRRSRLLVVDQNVRILGAHCDRIYLLDDGTAREAATGDSRSGDLRALYFD